MDNISTAQKIKMNGNGYGSIFMGATVKGIVWQKIKLCFTLINNNQNS